MVLLRVDASSEIGYGHLMRCICIADYFNEMFEKCLFILKNSEPKALAILQSKSLDYLVLKDETNILKLENVDSQTVIILDVNNRVLFSNSSEYRSYISFLKENYFKVVSFEEFSAEIFPSDLMIIPYVGAEKLGITNSTPTQLFLGPNYFIFREEFLNAPKIAIRPEVKSIFVCMGGTDPDQLTERYLRFLTNSGYPLNIKVVLSHLEDERSKEIKNILSSYSGSSELIINPVDLSSVISSCDIGIVNSGLIKYETSILGLPCLSISNNLHHEMVMSYFSESGCILHLGLADQVTADHFQSSLSTLIEKVEIRRQMNRTCQSLFDGKGIQRLYDYVMKFKNS